MNKNNESIDAVLDGFERGLDKFIGEKWLPVTAITHWNRIRGKTPLKCELLGNSCGGDPACSFLIAIPLVIMGNEILDLMGFGPI